jgi:hypothetical protein
MAAGLGLGEGHSIVNYSDDFVILSRGKAEEARAWMQAVMTRLGLTLNEQKTCIRNAKQESSDFLGYTFGPRYWWKTGKPYLAASPSKKAIQRLKEGVYEMLRPCEHDRWEEVRDRLNAKLRGWQNYFRYGSLNKAYWIVDQYVYHPRATLSATAPSSHELPRHPPVFRHSCVRSARGTPLPEGVTMANLRGPDRKSVGKPDAGNRHVRMETGLLVPRPSSTLPKNPI